jgi:hypothetical protein
LSEHAVVVSVVFLVKPNAPLFRILLESASTDESASQRQECFVDVSPLSIANAQAAKLTKPGEGSFYYPPPSAQSTAVFCVSLGGAKA